MDNYKARILVVIFTLLALWLAGLYGFTRNMTDTAPVTPSSRDAIVVLTGGSNRLETGFDLLDRQIGKKLFISGVYRGVEVKELIKLWSAEKKDAMQCCVVLGFEADNTFGNAKETVEWMRRENYTTMYLVTANYHLKRALLAFRIVGPDIDVAPYPVSPKGLDIQNWWRDKTYRSLVIREYMKYLASFILYLFPESAT